MTTTPKTDLPGGAPDISAILQTYHAHVGMERFTEEDKARKAIVDAFATLQKGLEPPGCPTPGACSCPGGEEELDKRLGEALRRVATLQDERDAAREEGDQWKAQALAAATFHGELADLLGCESNSADEIERAIKALQASPSPPLLEDLQTASVEATPGPWVAEPCMGHGTWIRNSTGKWSGFAGGETKAVADANSRLIVSAVNYIRSLLPQQTDEVKS